MGFARVSYVLSIFSILIFANLVFACIDTTGSGVCVNSIQTAYAANSLAAGTTNTGSPSSGTTASGKTGAAPPILDPNTGAAIQPPTHAAPPPAPPEANPITNPTVNPVAEPTLVTTPDDSAIRSDYTTILPDTNPNDQITNPGELNPGDITVPGNPELPVVPLPADYSCSSGASANKYFDKSKGDFCGPDCPEGMVCDQEKCACICDGYNKDNPLRKFCEEREGTFDPLTCSCTAKPHDPVRIVSCTANTNDKGKSLGDGKNAVCDGKCPSKNLKCDAASCTCACTLKEKDCTDIGKIFNKEKCRCERPPAPISCWSNSPLNPRYQGYNRWESGKDKPGATCDARCPIDPKNPNPLLRNLTCDPKTCACVPGETLKEDNSGKSPVTCSRHPGIYNPGKNYCIDNCKSAFGEGVTCNFTTCACDLACVSNKTEINCSLNKGAPGFDSSVNYCTDDCDKAKGYYCASNCTCVKPPQKPLNFSCSKPGVQPRIFIYDFDKCTYDCPKAGSERNRCDNFTCACTEGACLCKDKEKCLSNGQDWTWNSVNCTCTPPPSYPKQVPVSCSANTLAGGKNWRHSTDQVCVTNDCPKGKVCNPYECVCACDTDEKKKCDSKSKDGYKWDAKACACLEPVSCANNNEHALNGRICKIDCPESQRCDIIDCKCVDYPQPSPPPGFLDGLLKWLRLK